MGTRKDRFRAIQRDMAEFSARAVGMPLRSYQTEWANHTLYAACNHDTQIIAVEMSRQSGKNETAAHTEVAILSRMARIGGDIVKTAPTWKPQIVNSKRRLRDRARAVSGKISFLKPRGTEGYIIECGNASIQFLSASKNAAVVGATASLLLEIDEAQDVDRDKYAKDFSPMRASTGAPVLATGTTWTDDTLLAAFIRGIEEGRTPGKHYRVPWDRVAEDHPKYGEFVQGEIDLNGIDHPLIKTQYLLEPISGTGKLLDAQQLRLMVGRHPRDDHRTNQAQIVAGIDFAGSDETAGDIDAMLSGSSRDSVALTIGSVQWIDIAAGIIVPVVRILDRYEWTNQRAESLHAVLVRILRDEWKADRVHCDATGIGETATRLLQSALPAGVVHDVKFDGGWSTHTRLAFRALAQINRGHLIDYAPGFDVLDVARREAADRDDPTRHVWYQRGHARLEARPGKKVRAYVPDAEGHDDLLIADMLLVDAAHEAGAPRPVDEGSQSFVTWS